MTAYATQQDVYTFGLPRGALGNPGRIVDSALASTSAVTLAEHGLSSGMSVTFRVSQGGALPAPLVAGTQYFVLYLSDSIFQISATLNGSPITFTTDGISAIVAADLPFAQILEFYSRFVDGFLPAHVVPLTAPYPITVVALVAQLSAKRLQIISGVISESMNDLELSAKAQLERYAKTIPLRDIAPTTKSANQSVNQSVPMSNPNPTPLSGGINTLTTTVVVSPGDPRGWAWQGSGVLP